METPARNRNAVTTFLVERYWPGVTEGAFADAAGRLDGCLEDLRREGVSISTVAATLVPEDEAAYWVMDGPSAEAITLAFARAGMPAERIVVALDLRRST